MISVDLNSDLGESFGAWKIRGLGLVPFDDAIALIWARFMADGKAAGRPGSALDTIIAAVAEANNCVVVTGNGKGLAGVEFINSPTAVRIAEVSPKQARIRPYCSAVRRSCNTERPHSSLGYKPPAPEAIVWPAPPRGLGPADFR